MGGFCLPFAGGNNAQKCPTKFGPGLIICGSRVLQENEYTGLFEKIVSVLTTRHTQYTCDRSM